MEATKSMAVGAGNSAPGTCVPALRFWNTTFIVQDVKATVAFYAGVFGLTCRYVHPSGEYAELESCPALLSFTGEKLVDQFQLLGPLAVRANRPGLEPIAAQIAFVSQDVDASYANAVSAGAVSVCGPKPMPWGQTLCYVRDLNGVLVEICSPPIR
jgi:lactoylglutathione lyase